MRITALETSGFGNLPDARVEFSGGLTVVRGPNEAGKSFMMRAISEGLFGDGASAAGDIRDRCRKWNSDGSFFVRIEIVHEGEAYALTRDYGNKKNTLEKPDGSELKDKKKIASWVASVTGLPSATSFRATACIPQEEVEVVGEESAGLRKIIEGRLAGSGSEVDALLKKLTRKKEGILSKNRQKGLLAEQRSLAGALAAEMEAARARVSALAVNKKGLAGVRAELEERSRALEDKRSANEGLTKYITASKEHAAAGAAFDRDSQSLDRCRAAKKDILDSEKALERLKGELDTLAAGVEKAEEFNREDSARDGLEKERESLEKTICSVEGLDARIEKERAALDAMKAVDPVELANARRLPDEIAGLGAALSQLLFSVEVKVKGGVEYALTVDGEGAAGPAAEAHAEAIVDFPQLASVHFKNLTGEGGPIVDEIERKKAVLRDILTGYGVKDVEGLERLVSERGKSEGRLAGLRDKRGELLQEGDLAELKARASEQKEAIAEHRLLWEGLKPFALTPEGLESKRGRKTALEREIKEKETARDKGRGVLETVGEDEAALQDAMKATAKTLAVAEASLDELQVYKCTAEEFEKQRREIGGLARRVDDLKQDEMRLSLKIEQENIGEEDAAALEENLGLAETRVARLEQEHEVARLIIENIASARADTIARFSGGIEERMGEILSSITGGKYSRVEVDGGLGVRVYSPEKGDFVEPDRKSVLLSSGTIDQMQLAARLALLELIAGEARPPVIMDDTFVSFDDMGRKERAFRLMRSVADEYQVLYFTCHNSPDNLETIEVGEADCDREPGSTGVTDA